MDYLEKSQIIIEFTEQYINDEEFVDFFDYNDLGVPVAVAVANSLVTLTDGGRELIDETWQGLCSLFDADPNKEYESIDDLID